MCVSWSPPWGHKDAHKWEPVRLCADGRPIWSKGMHERETSKLIVRDLVAAMGRKGADMS